MGEAEPRLGWERVSSLESRGKVDGSLKGEKVFVGVGVRGGREGILAMFEHGTREVGGEVTGLGAEV